ncbi:MAG: extracellular solute-binding protein [Oscillospiraceae bacterium]|nr:extracellular solute-binding protein [Oscillospiraceae bacterium]
MNNKKKLIKAVCILSAAALTAASFTACGKKTDGNETDGSSEKGNSAVGSDTAGDTAGELVKINYQCDKIKLSDELKSQYFDSFSVSDSGVSLIYNDYQWNEETMVSTVKTYLYILGFDGSVISKTDISVEKINDNDNASVNNVNYLSDGSVVFIENHYYPVEDTSDNGEGAADEGASDGIMPLEEETAETEIAAEEEVSAETEAASESYDDYEYDQPYNYVNKMAIVHMSAEGEIISRNEFSDVPALKAVSDNPNNYIQYIRINSSGDMAIAYQSYDEEWNCSTGVVVINKDNEQLFSKSFDGNDTGLNGCYSDGDGDFCFVVSQNEEGRYVQVVKKCNLQTGEFEDVCDWTSNSGAETMINGSGDHQGFYYNYNNNSIMGFKKDGSSEVMLNLLNNGVYIDSVNSMAVNGDDFYILSYDYGIQETVIYKLRKLDDSEIKEKEQVTLASYNADSSLQSAVAEYNRSDGNYVITVTEYSQYNDYSSEDEDAWNAGLTRLNSEISSGQIPDIISISDPEMLASFSAKGLFVDLNSYIDGENGIDRNEYFDNIFRAMETDGKLYTITASVSIQGACAKKSLIPEDGPVTWEQVDSILGQHSGMSLLAADISRDSFMDSVLSCGYRNFVDTSAGECRFNTPEFVELLERAKAYPEEINYEELESSDPDFWNNYNMQYRNDQVLLAGFQLYGFDNYYYTADGMMGEDVSIIGMPGSGSGAYLYPRSYVSVSAKSAHPDAGWELIKSMIEYDEDKYSSSNYYSISYNGFPVNKQAYQKVGEAAIEASYYTDENGEKVQNQNQYYINDNETVTLRNVDQALIDRLNSFISSTDNVFMGIESGIKDIINEEAAAFYAGTSTAQQAADNIQNRASLYLSEHS